VDSIDTFDDTLAPSGLSWSTGLSTATGVCFSAKLIKAMAEDDKEKVTQVNVPPAKPENVDENLAEKQRCEERGRF
jgi:hypothetical protein